MATTTTDRRVNSRIQNYTGFWPKDISQDSKVDADTRVENYTEVVNGYYDGLMNLYDYRWGKSFHFSRFYKGEGFYQSLARHERYLAFKMRLTRGMRVLDVGCGVGGPALQIAGFADVNIVGVNNNNFQIGCARKYTAKRGLQDQVQFVKGDFMKLSEQFGERTFDAVYAIEATMHAPTWEGVYGEISKVLKPGGIFGVYEWCMTNTWDPSIPAHKALAHRIELGNGIPQMRSYASAIAALENVGFNILLQEDLAEGDDPVKWYYPLEGDWWKAQTMQDMLTCWLTSWSEKLITNNVVWLMEKTGFAPKGAYDVRKALNVAANPLVDGGRQKLFTPMLLIIASKPLAISDGFDDEFGTELSPDSDGDP